MRRSSTLTSRRCCNTLKPLRCVRGFCTSAMLRGRRRPEAWRQDSKQWSSKFSSAKGMVERGVDTNHMMIAEFTNNHKLDAKNIGEAIFKLHEKIEHLQAQIYDLQNQNCEYEYRFKRMSLAADLRIPETRSSFYDGEPMPWKMDDNPTSSTTPPPSSPTKEI